jgi:hypothetical protein
VQVRRGGTRDGSSGPRIQQRRVTKATDGGIRPIVTLVRHGLGNGFPREVVIRPEPLGDTVRRLFGNKDEDVGDASLDNALDD